MSLLAENTADRLVTQPVTLNYLRWKWTKRMSFKRSKLPLVFLANNKKKLVLSKKNKNASKNCVVPASN